MNKKIRDVDTYIASAPMETRTKLSQLRRIVKGIVPEATEGISYTMPFYKYHGMLVGFAVFKKHIGFFVPTPVVEEHKHLLKGYETGKATVRLPLDKPIPVGIIKKLIRSRAKKNKAKKKSK
ncbi:MAG TPA: DUF1801 domain-containing protein [Nitrosopumilaceae archaeon]|nr:DUF1801 domain-containing protein [Nitrosopumilaceae archaeon]